MAGLDMEIRFLKGVGEKRAAAFAKLGIRTVGDLLCHFPRRYEDRMHCTPIAAAQPDEWVCIRAMVATEPTVSRIRRGLELVKLLVVDDSGSVSVTYFNQTYIKNQLLCGETYYFYGKLSGEGKARAMANPDWEPESAPAVTTRCIMPVYHLSAGLGNKYMIGCVRRALELAGEDMPDYLPESVRQAQGLAQARFSYENIHLPTDLEMLELARRRLIFEEFFVLACAMERMGKRAKNKSGFTVKKSQPEQFYSRLPFSPTGAQRRAAEQCMDDMASGCSMNRLIQGDVGSGKTIVAAACVWAVCAAGRQAAFMAPTEILAEQHFRTLSAFLEPFGITVELLTGAMSAKAKREVKARLASGQAQAIVGTHALLTADTEFAALSLVITDEQHRFGVEQRSALAVKGNRPHTLVMSATPIPRTLALMIYGDLDISVLDELPPGRQKVDTFCVNSSYHQRLNNFIRKQAAAGYQTFVVCPMVEESDADSPAAAELKSAVDWAEQLRRELPELRIQCIHGKMKPKEKDAVMKSVVNGEADVLVSTTVIEVGVDVPHASLMIVENAERFGLSQLHQLRGRVGRGNQKSWCVLVTDNQSEETRARMKIMCSTADGFEISRADLAMRGPGDFFGSRQHGLPEMRIADLCGDITIMQTAQEAAKELLARDADLASPECRALAKRIETLFSDGNIIMS